MFIELCDIYKEGRKVHINTNNICTISKHIDSECTCIVTVDCTGDEHIAVKETVKEVMEKIWAVS